MSQNLSPDLFKEDRLRVGKFACEICGGEFPITQKRIQSGLRVGLMCCYEPSGGEVERDQRRAANAIIAGRIAAEELKPPEYEGEAFYGVEETPEDQSFCETVTPNPVVLIRGGAAVPVTLSGVNFSATDTIGYGAAGITDAAPPSNVSSTEWDLSVHASNSTPVGLYSFTFNGTTWQYVFDVR